MQLSISTSGNICLLWDFYLWETFLMQDDHRVCSVYSVKIFTLMLYTTFQLISDSVSVNDFGSAYMLCCCLWNTESAWNSVRSLRQSSWSSWKELNKERKVQLEASHCSIFFFPLTATSSKAVPEDMPPPLSAFNSTNITPDLYRHLSVILKQRHWGPERFAGRSHWLQILLFLMMTMNPSVTYRLFSLKRFS